ncbi:MAG: HYR domain-containing protein [Planctomycetes bacterium]|nr:HYR domain-containing protein [Planctomycetota bacterium]
MLGIQLVREAQEVARLLGPSLHAADVRQEGVGAEDVERALLPGLVQRACGSDSLRLFELEQQRSRQHASQCTFFVVVIDTTPPEINAPPFIFREAPPGVPGTIVTFPPFVHDLCDPSPSVVFTPASGSFFPLGPTRVTCVATDASGNQSIKHFTVGVGPRPHPPSPTIVIGVRG